MKFTIYMDRWLRGEGQQASALQRPSDGKRCCVGQYCVDRAYSLAACPGVPLSLEFVEQCNHISDKKMTGQRWELDDVMPTIHCAKPSVAGLLYVLNDIEGVADEDRIPWIKAGFEAAGHEVEFAEGWGPRD